MPLIDPLEQKGVMSEHKWTPAVTSSGRPCMFRSEVNEVVAALEAKLSKMEENISKHITHDLMRPLVLGQITEDEFDEDTFGFAVWSARKMMRKALAGGEEA